MEKEHQLKKSVVKSQLKEKVPENNIQANLTGYAYEGKKQKLRTREYLLICPWIYLLTRQNTKN